MSGKRGLGSWIYKSQYGVFSHQNCRPILRRPSSRGGSLDSPSRDARVVYVDDNDFFDTLQRVATTCGAGIERERGAQRP
jgi:hypothetical protein